MTDSERAIPEVVPEEGETYMAAHERMLRETAGIGDLSEPDGEVLGVLTGQVPVRSMPISMNNPIGPEEDTVSEQISE